MLTIEEVDALVAQACEATEPGAAIVVRLPPGYAPSAAERRLVEERIHHAIEGAREERRR